jgi:hypothetical protein
MPHHPKRRYRAPEAADYVRVAVSTLAKYRMNGLGPRYCKAGPRIVVYEEDDLDSWLLARARRSTSSADTEVKETI